MDGDRSGTISMGEFIDGISHNDIDLEREEYMRLFKAVDKSGNNSLTRIEVEKALYPHLKSTTVDHGDRYGRHTSNNLNDGSNPFSEYGTRNTQVLDKRHSAGEDNPFPEKRKSNSKEDKDAEREALLKWLKDIVRAKKISSERLFGVMDGDRSGTISMGEFIDGISHNDIDLEREEYMRLFKACDVSGDNSLTRIELEKTLYPGRKSSTVDHGDRYGRHTSNNLNDGSNPFSEYGTRNTQVLEKRSSATEDNPFPEKRKSNSKEDKEEERKALLQWLRKILRAKKISPESLFGVMDNDRSNTISMGEFIEGIAHHDIDLDRPQYMRLFKACDVSGDNSLTRIELEKTLYPGRKSSTVDHGDRYGRHTSNNLNDGSNPFSEYGTRNTQVLEKRSSATEDNPFPEKRKSNSKEDKEEERKALLQWLRKILRAKKISPESLFGVMDNDRSNTISMGEFIEGIAHHDIDLDRPQYMRLFKACDVSGDNSLTRIELEKTLYPKRKSSTVDHGDRYGRHTSNNLNDGSNPFSEYGTRNTQVLEKRSSATKDNPFPEKRKTNSKEDKEEERKALLQWLRKEIKAKRVGPDRLFSQMDADRSGKISLNEFVEGIATNDIDLDRPQYMRLFKACDKSGDNSLTKVELEKTLYPGQPLSIGT
eukprot:g2941.t1